jgi:hypothetical protein
MTLRAWSFGGVVVSIAALAAVHLAAASATGADAAPGPMDPLSQHMKALEFFKDWSNYLLVTTVAALGWLATTTASITTRRLCVWLFALSAVFAIFTLALIPIVGEELVKDKSFYDVWGNFHLFWFWIPVSLPLKAVCFPQHVLFILGIIAYACGVKSNDARHGDSVCA